MSGEKTVAQRRGAIAVPTGVLRVGRGGPSITIGAETILLGRDASCQLGLDDTEVSAIHAEVFVQNGTIWLRDCNSLNGTYLHGTRVREFELAKPTTFTVGSTPIEFTPSTTEVLAPEGDDFHGLAGAAPAMKQLFEHVQRLASTPLSILILGETGTGKELMARAIHAASPRASKPFEVVDCGAISSTLAESTLFGHERGAFTGAIKQQLSPFLKADGGTVFLDELGELPIDIQPKLLRALGERHVRSLGGSKFQDFDVRIVAATRRDLPSMANEGIFRSDLYFRIAQAKIKLPPLRDRPADIPLLVRGILQRLGHSDAFDRVTDESLEYAMHEYKWPGNVRELRNAVEVALSMAAPGAAIDLVKGIVPSGDEPPPVDDKRTERATVSWAACEKAYYADLSRRYRGNKSAMARVAEVRRETVAEKLRKYEIEPDE